TLYERPENLFVARFMGHRNLFPIHTQDDAGVWTDLGRITGRFEPGSHLLIRPEVVALEQEASGNGKNQLSATVQESICRGSVTEYRLQCGETELIAKCNNYGQRMFDLGESVTAIIETGGVVAL